MNMHRISILMFFIIIFSIGYMFAQEAPQRLFVNIAEENLRIAPQGQKIGTLLNGTEAIILAEQENWVKVQITGWIWRDSMSAIRPRNVPGEMRALHIMVATKEEAEAILAELKSGKDFAEIAKKKSKGPNAKNGGDLGYFMKGDFQPEFENAIEKTKVGGISEIVKTNMGYHIFKRLK